MNDVTDHDIAQALRALVEENGLPAARLLRRIPVTDLALAMTQEIEDGFKTDDYDFLRGLDGVLKRALLFHEQSL